MFRFLRNNANSNQPAIMVMPTTESTNYAVGDALVMTSGKLAKATGTTKPTFICAEKYDAPASDNKDIAVYPVYETEEWETTLAVEGTLTPGTKVTIHTDAAQVTATTTSGVAEVISAEGSAIGSKVVVKF